MEDNCPKTPLHVMAGRNSKSPNPMTVSSPDSDGMKSPNGRLSPDSRCVICLEKLREKSFTDSCLHHFCFQCLLQWSKVKPECPLCKQPFKSIIHNVRSNFDYDQYHIESREPAYVVSEILHSYDFNLLPVHRRFRYRSTMTREYFREIAENFLTNGRNSYQVSDFVHPPTFYIPPATRYSPVNERRGARSSIDFRRNVYEQDLWVRDLVDVTGRYRECSPQFYRENPAQMHRIIPWLSREVNSLMQGNVSYIAYIVDRIISLLPECSIRSRQFRDAVEPYFGNRTDHFIHEFHTFARSVYDINGFDQNAVYVRNPDYSTEVQEISLSSISSDDSDVEIIEMTHPKGSVSRRRKKFTRTEGTGNSSEPIAGPSGINNSRLTETIEVCESDTDDIKVFEYVKPEPEVITLSSGDEQLPDSGTETARGGSSNSRKNTTHKNWNDTSTRWQQCSGKHDRCRGSRRMKTRKKYSEKSKSDGLCGKGRQSRSSGRSKKNRSYSDTSRSRSRSSSSSYDSCSSDSVSVLGDSVTSHSDSDSDREQSCRSRSRKGSKRHHKKLKKSTSRKSSHKNKETRSSSIGLSSSGSTVLGKRKRSKVKSCVVVPNSAESRQSDAGQSGYDFGRKGSWKFSGFANPRNDDESSSYLPPYWSLAYKNE